MTINILMPALSPTMEEGTLAKWLIKVGDKISAGDIIAEIETDKATMEIETVDEGIIENILIQEGTEGVKVNSIIATIKTDNEDIPQKKENDEFHQTENKKDISDTKIETSKKTTLTVREAIRKAIEDEMTSDEDVFLMGEEVAEYNGAYKVSQGLLEKFGPERVIDTPITEYGFAGIGAGAAFAGLKPIVEFMTFNFAMQAIDHIVNSAAKTLYMSGGQLGCPIVFRGPNGAAARVGAQHSQDYASWYAQIPGLKVVTPYSSEDAYGLLRQAIQDPNPVVFLENEILYGQSFSVPDNLQPIEFGKARVWEEGSDITIVSFGIGMKYALEAHKELQNEGISSEIIDLRTVRPIDYDTILNSVKKTNRCITVEEGFPVCSIGNHLAAYIMQNAFDYLDAPVINCTGKDVPMPYAANLEKLALTTTKEVVNAAKEVCYRS